MVSLFSFCFIVIAIFEMIVINACDKNMADDEDKEVEV